MRRAGVIVAALAGVAMGLVALEAWLLDGAVEGARACFANLERGASHGVGECLRYRRWLWLSEKMPWARVQARRVAEELEARAAVTGYLDAAVGSLDEQAMHDRFEAVRRAAVLVEVGTGRQRLDELGRPISTPEPGQLAYLAGDRRTLIDSGFEWTQHYTEKDAVRAALSEGDVKRAVRLGQHYAGRPNTDLRVMIAALLCLGDEQQRGMDQIVGLEKSRAEKRAANFSRHFGHVRLVIEGCAGLGRLQAPEIPHFGYAGSWDHRERLMALRLRRLRADQPCDFRDDSADCLADATVGQNVAHVRKMLEGVDPLRYRLELLALVAERLRTLAEVVALAAPREGEPSLAERLPLLVDDFLGRAPDEPFLTAEQLLAAARHLEGLAVDVPSRAADQVATVAAVLRVRAAGQLALRGEGEAARAALDGMVRPAADGYVLATLRASIELVAGDPERAAEAVESPNLDMVVAAGDQRRGQAALALQRALIAAGTPRGAAAASHAVAVAARAQADDVLQRARWLELAHGVKDPKRPAAPPGVVPWVGVPPSRDPALPPEVRLRLLESALGAWQGWLSRPAAEHRGLRWLLFLHRGDAPDALGAYQLAAGKLAPPDKVERWLDALGALDQRRFTLRRYAFSRYQAALWRGDQAAARLWLDRFRTLARWSQDPARAELYQELGI